MVWVALGLTVWAQDDPKKAREEAAKKAVEDFKAAIKDAKNIHEKALAILAFGESDVHEGSMVPPVAKYLLPGPGDINYLLPVTTADALGKFRGVLQASQALQGALAQYKKTPYVYSKIYVAIGRVGHESSFALFEEALKGNDVNAASGAVEAISEMPPAVAVEKLFEEYEREEGKRKNATAEFIKVYDRCQPEIIKAVKKLSEQPYPTINELKLWWSKHNKEFKAKAEEKEKERLAKKESTAKPTLPPPMIIELVFRENGGAVTANTGSSSGLFPQANITKDKPSWTADAPPNGGPSAIDFGPNPGNYAVDLNGGPGIENLRNLKSFTITGFLNCRSDKESPAGKDIPPGNRIVSWLNYGKDRDGVELVYRSGGSLQLGIGQWADASSAVSKSGKIAVVDEKAKDPAQASRANWRFFAVTYDSTAASGHVKFYFSENPYVDAKLDVTVDYDKGPTGAKIAPYLTVGNLPAQARPMSPDKNFRGGIDELRIFGSTLDGSGALDLPHLIKIQNRPPAN
jgi:hypothetical protein